tara:strand:+ start:321 stop:506 length:186 start_codon:yes stop_codon:yes gene_type:complete
MTITIQEKIESTKAELQTIVEEHNKLAERKQELLNKATELQGALKVLNELNGDQPTEGESS